MRRHPRRQALGTALAALVLVWLLPAPSASAGIIVTEGRIAATDAQNSELGACGELDGPGQVADGECDGGDGTQDPLTDLESEPLGWNCTLLALGIEYCEPDAGGPDKGLRPGGKKGKHHGAGHGDEDGYACSGAGAPIQAAPVALALLALFGFVRRRRRA